jgi:hypothetical protein
MTKRLFKKIWMGSVRLDELTGTINEVTEKLHRIHKEAVEAAKVSLVGVRLDVDEFQEDELTIHGLRLETDQEVATRVERTKRAKQRRKDAKIREAATREEKDKKEYERLKAKFGA